MSGREKLVRSIVEILRADDLLRREVLDELEGYDPRLPDRDRSDHPPHGKLKER